MKKQIVVNVKAAKTLPLDSLQPFQDGLKTSTTESMANLKQGILDEGICLALSVWPHKGKNNVIDGHQRIPALRELEQEGWKIPPIPVNIVEAKTVAEAKRKVLLGAGVAGRVQMDALTNFMAKNKLDRSALDRANLPNPGLLSIQSIDVQAHTRSVGGVGEDPSNNNVYKTNAERLETFLGSDVRRLSLVMGPKDYERLLNGLTEICEEHELETHGEAVLFLLEKHEDSKA